jgi:hypothetical protein
MLIARRYITAAALTIGVGIVAPGCAAQTYASYDGYYQRPGVERAAFENGAREGREEDRVDARARHQFSFAQHHEYRDADEGYRPSDGDLQFYRRAFRQGFERGYGEAFKQAAAGYGDGYLYPGPQAQIYPTAPPYASPAVRNGYRDGLEVGRDDARNRDRYDPAGAGRYRSGDHDYDRRYGSKDQYQREYRAAFALGYAEGYRSSRETER